MSTEPTKLVPYRRVSTKYQGASGLGLEGQEMDVERYRASVNGVIVREFTEIETGTRKRTRPVLAEALQHCKRTGSTLVIAKLDRLSRNVHFLSGLMEAGVDFVCCDMPNANRLTLHIMAAVAEQEAAMISERVKKALDAFKANRRVPRRLRETYGENVPQDVADAVAGKLGASLPQCRNLTDEARRRGAETTARTVREEAIKDNAHLTPRMLAWRSEGKSLKAIAESLNAAGETTRTGCAWSAKQVQRVLERAG